MQARSRKGITVHRRQALNTTTHHGIPVTTVAQTLIDVATNPQIEQMIGKAILQRRITLKALRTAATNAGRAGAPLRSLIDRVTFRVTQSELERVFLRLVQRAGVPMPDTQRRFGRYRVDFAWPAVGLVVETDGPRFHATPFQQGEDRRRDRPTCAPAARRSGSRTGRCSKSRPRPSPS